MIQYNQVNYSGKKIKSIKIKCEEYLIEINKISNIKINENLNFDL